MSVRPSEHGQYQEEFRRLSVEFSERTTFIFLHLDPVMESLKLDWCDITPKGLTEEEVRLFVVNAVDELTKELPKAERSSAVKSAIIAQVRTLYEDVNTLERSHQSIGYLVITGVLNDIRANISGSISLPKGLSF